ncbi:hypothetical protein PI126_g24167 [Phytophthora idaei]|nr:hypothetical protein PI126_g24167 [Phytophthora idaei]
MEPDLADEEEKDAHDDEDGDSTPPYIGEQVLTQWKPPICLRRRHSKRR